MLAVVACCFFAPSIAFGAAPPGNAAVQEFVESLPDGTGLRPSNSIAEFRSEALAKGRVVDKKTRSTLVSRWPDGEDVISLAEASGFQPPRRRSPPEPAGGGESALKAAVERIPGGSGPDGMGFGLPLVLLASAVAAAAYVLVRRAQTPGSSR